MIDLTLKFQITFLLFYIPIQTLCINYYLKTIYTQNKKKFYKLLKSYFLLSIYSGISLFVILFVLFYKSIRWWILHFNLDYLFYISVIISFISMIPPIVLILSVLFSKIRKLDSDKNIDPSKRNLFNKTLIPTSLALFSFSGLSYNLYMAKENIEIVKIKIPFSNLPDSFDGYKIIHISDIHSGFFIREVYLNKVVEFINQLQGDLLVLTGDFITATKQFLPELISALSNLNNSYIKVGVLGNHDYHHPKEVEQSLNQIGIPLLKNNKQTLIKKNDSIHIVGIEDLWSGLDDIDKATNGLNLEDFTILLCHNPDFIPKAVEYNFNLMLSGHTHGGQVRFPVIGSVFVPSKFGVKYAHGLYLEQNTYLYVNRGIGVTEPPLRFLCKPEITEITLIKG